MPKFEVEMYAQGFRIKENRAVNEANVPMMDRTFYAGVTYEDMKNLQGKILTVIDAAIGDKQQNKAVKDIMNRTLWFDWADGLFRGMLDVPAGIPIEEI